MRSKSPELKSRIIDFVNEVYRIEGVTPTIRRIADSLNVSKSCISNYINEMEREGLIEKNDGWYGIRTNLINKLSEVEMLPVVGNIACGPMLLAEQNIESYIPVAKNLLGSGKFFALVAKGDSMINAGISDGDTVIIRLQNSAEEGQIVIARADDEATLKRYYVDRKNKRIRLHPENDRMQDMFYDKIDIQGVAVKVIKDL